jgi:hypothetical protein
MKVAIIIVTTEKIVKIHMKVNPMKEQRRRKKKRNYHLIG